MIRLLAFDVLNLPLCAQGYRKIFECKQLKGIYKCGLGNHNYFKYCESHRVYFNSYPLHNFYDIHFQNEYLKRYMKMYDIEHEQNILLLSTKPENLFISANNGYRILQVNNHNINNISSVISQYVYYKNK